MSVSLNTRNFVIHKSSIADLEEELYAILEYYTVLGGEACFVNGEIVYSRKSQYSIEYQKRVFYDIIDIVNSIMYMHNEFTEDSISIVEVFATTVNIVNIVICQ